MKVPLLPKETLGLAAEFAVASELCGRGIYAQLTLGNRKRTDLLIDDEGGKMLRVQVKSKQQRVWPGVKGVCGLENILVLVDYESKSIIERPDFYVLTQSDWKAVTATELVTAGRIERGEVSLNDQLIPTWKDGFVGMSIRPQQVQEYREKWEKVHELLGVAR